MILMCLNMPTSSRSIAIALVGESKLKMMKKMTRIKSKKRKKGNQKAKRQSKKVRVEPEKEFWKRIALKIAPHSQEHEEKGHVTSQAIYPRLPQMQKIYLYQVMISLQIQVKNRKGKKIIRIKRIKKMKRRIELLIV